MMMTFVELINEYGIFIPKIQRDYAQGRAKYDINGFEITSEKPYQVRTGLVNALYDGIKNQSHINLNFVYGKRGFRDGQNIFIPVDGQQRLTTLFLLHWYVYQLAGLESMVSALGAAFTYDTRDTTKSFCEEICKKKIIDTDDYSRIESLINSNAKDKNNYRLSTKIKDMVWFNSSYASDPSVISMLNMIDTIEERFAFDYRTQNDYCDIAEFLNNNEICHISFSHLDIENFDEKDMYIKMNARGKELTNFELFKALIEEGNTLCDICYSDTDSEEKRSHSIAEFIGKYNTDFVNFFYSIPCGNSNGIPDSTPEKLKGQFDFALFNFVECFIKLDHFAYITGYTEISERLYQNDVSNIVLSGTSLFNDYILDPKLHGYNGDDSNVYKDDLKSIAKKSMRKITGILDFFNNTDFCVFPAYKNSIEDNDTFFDEKEFLISNYKKTTNLVLIKQYALFSFFYFFECNNDLHNKLEAYKEWKRFVFNITYKFSIKDPVNFPKMAGVLDAILIRLQEKYFDNNKVISADDVLTVIANYESIQAVINMSNKMKVIRRLFDSEKRKAGLMLDLDISNRENWRRLIREAEAYYEDGNIDFIFDALKTPYSPKSFEEAFKRSTVWIDEKKNPKDPALFNNALLCIDYNTELEEMAHLKINNYVGVWQLFIGKQTNLRDALLNSDDDKTRGLQYGVKKLLTEYDLNSTPYDYAKALRNAYENKANAWLRNTLVNENLVDKIIKYNKFSGTIGRWSSSTPNEYILFFSTAYNSCNLELNTFRLAMKLIDEHPDLSIEKILSGKNRSLAIRFVRLNGKSVSYDITNQLFYNIDRNEYFDPVNNDNGMNKAIEYLTVN